MQTKKPLPPKFYVSITGLKPKSFWTLFSFWRHAIPSKIQADSAPGILFSGVHKINGIQHTLTAWESKEHMKAYISTGAHAKAMKLFRRIATGKTLGFDSDRLPSWDEVHEIWRTQGRDY